MKKILSSALVFGALLGCSKVSSTHSKTNGLIGSDDSVEAIDKPEFADVLTRPVRDGYAISCNGVKLSDGRFLTAAHCLKKHSNAKNILLLGKKIVTNLNQVGSYDLAKGEIIGSTAPSESIKIFEGTLPATFTLEATWFDITRNQWRYSKGRATADGAFIKHELDTLPGSSGSALYILNERGDRLLVGIHLGFNRKANINVGLILSKAFDKNFVQPASGIADNLETEGEEHLTLVCSKSTGECFLVPDGSGDGGGSGEGGTGDAGDNPSGGGEGGSVGGTGGNSTGGGNGGSDGGTGGNPTGGSDGGSDGGDTGGEGSDGGYDGGEGGEGGLPPVVVVPDRVPGGGNTNGGNTEEIKDCFNCDTVRWELEKNDLFKPSCNNSGSGSSSNVGPMLAPGNGPSLDLGKPEEKLPEFRFNPSDSQFTESLKDFAQKLIEATKWETLPSLSDKMSHLSAETLAKMREWTEKVVGNLDDYYALLISTVKSDELESPTMPEIDVTKEGIEASQKYLDAVKEQILKNPDQYQKARLEIAESGGRALALAKDALERGDIETAEAAVEIGRALTDAAIGFAPVAGWVKDVVEATTGYNFITKQELTRFELVSAWVGVFSAGYGSKILAVGKAVVIIGVVKDISKSSRLAHRLEEAGLSARDIYSAAVKAGIKDKRRIGEVFDAVKTKLPGAKSEVLETEITDAFKRFEGLPIINGLKPKNGHFTGNPYYAKLKESLKTKYPDGVKFNEKGFPDFSPYAMKFKNGETSVVIEAGLKRKDDFKAANKAADLTKTPKGYTWHHHEDTGVMQLIPTDLHKAVSHTGGWTIWGGGLKL